MSKNRIKKLALPVPTRKQAEQALFELANEQVCLSKLIAEKNAKILAIEEDYAKIVDQSEKAIFHHSDQIRRWAEANPQEFEKRKSIQFPAGTVGFRTGTPALKLLSKWTWEKALFQVQVRLPAFIRDVPQIDKEAIIAQRNELEAFLPACGIKVAQGESFFIEPKLEETESRQKVGVAA